MLPEDGLTDVSQKICFPCIANLQTGLMLAFLGLFKAASWNNNEIFDIFWLSMLFEISLCNCHIFLILWGFLWTPVASIDHHCSCNIHISWFFLWHLWIPWNLSFRYIHCTGQFTPKMKANAKTHLLSSLVWIDSGIVVSQHRLESFYVK